MTVGMIIRDENGKVLIDMTKNIGKILGKFNTGTSNGSLSPSLPLAGTVFYIQSPLVDGGRFSKQAAVVYSNGNFNWSFSYPDGIGNYSVDSVVYYGVY